MTQIKSHVFGWALAGAALLWVAGMGCARAQTPTAQVWHKPYAGEDASGPAVLGLWQFQPGAEARDASGQGHNLTLQGGAVFTKDGPFGGCLESFGPGDKDKVSGALAANSTNMTPTGTFTIEMWINPKPEFEEDTKGAWLLDKMYVNYKHNNPKQECQRDYALRINPPVKGERTLVAYLGFGDSVATYTSKPVRFATHVWHHIAFAYDGAGKGRFYCDGEAIGGGSEPGRKGVMPGTRPVVIGDRGGSSYYGFPGFISQVRIYNQALRFYSGKIGLSLSGRTAFVRMEKQGRMECLLINNRNAVLSGASLVVALEGTGECRLRVPHLEAGAEYKLVVPVDTTVRPGRYAVRAAVLDADGQILASATNAAITLVPRPLPFRMPVVLWGGVKIGDEQEFALMKRIGFTHSLCGAPVTEKVVWDAGRPVAVAEENYRRQLDYALANDHAVAAQISSALWLGDKPAFQRVDRAGKPYANKGIAINTCGMCSGAVEFCYNIGASIARSYGEYPGLQAALIHSEVRDSSEVCFHESDRAAYRAFAGTEIPGQVVHKNGISYKSVKDFPADRIIPDDDPLLTYYRWFWKQGDGWNQIHSAVHRGLKSTGRKDLWTWYDPAVRVPSVYGSGGEVDVISQWTYSYPDPIRIALATDELFAMAAGAKTPQQVMKMTQIIWYRTQTAPKPKPGATHSAPQSAWQKTVPEADFITIAPDHLREAFWSKIARPIQGIMYHGWQSLVDRRTTNGYCYTNPETQEVLTQLTHDVVRPLGPTLRQVPDRKSDVGYLESFASQMFAGKGSRGWSGDDMYLVMQYAQLQPRILYDETILAGGLKGLKVMVMADCDVLTRSVADKVKTFQRNGGLIVADEFLAPAIMPDILLTKPVRTGKPDVDKAAIQAKAVALRKDLDSVYRRPADSSNNDVITRVRRYGTTDYLFAVNDRRTFGDYVGQWGLVMEKGLPTEATLILNRPGGYAYELVAGQPVPAIVTNGALQIKRQFGPGGGTVLMVTDRAIAGVTVQAPRQAKLGRSAKIHIAVVDAEGRALDAVVPVQVDIRDATGKPAEWSGYYGAKDGRLDLTLDLASNDAPGTWTIRVKELASGKAAEKTWMVKKGGW